MEDLEKKIILQLFDDAEQPVVDIAEEVGASRQTVSKKMEQLKESGVIRDLTIRLSPEEFGLNVRAYVFFQEDPKEEVREGVEEKINNFRQVSRFLRLFGRYSGIVEIWAESRDELTSFVKEIHELEGVRETETFIVHSTAKDKPEDPFLNILKED